MEIKLKEKTIKIKENSITTFMGDNNILNLVNSSVKSVRIVYDNTEIYLKKKTVKEEFQNIEENKVRKSLKIVGLKGNILEKSSNELSKGEQKKLSLAIALSYNPKILIIEEPFKNLDWLSKEYTIKLFKMMKIRYNKTIIIVTKDIENSLYLSDYIYIVKKGKIIKEGNKYILSDSKVLNSIPNLLEFSNIVKEKTNINIGYRDDIKDLIKDIYRNVERKIQ